MKKNREPEIKQPTDDMQREYISLRDNDATNVYIRKKKYRLRWLRNGQVAKLSRVLLGKEKNVDTQKIDNALDEIIASSKLGCKIAAIYLLDGYWKLKFRYWYLWRWFYYIRQYDSVDLKDVLDEGKKKIPLPQFCETIMLLTGAKDTVMMMRTAEAERILRGLTTEQLSPQPKKDNG